MIEHWSGYLINLTSNVTKQILFLNSKPYMIWIMHNLTNEDADGVTVIVSKKSTW